MEIRNGVKADAFTPMGLPILMDAGNANDNSAQVTLALWNDYKTNFAPYSYGMLDSLTTQNPGIVEETVGKAQEQVGRSFDVAGRNRQLAFSRLGMAPDAQTSAAMDRQASLARAAATVGAANTTRMGLKERDMMLMTSGVPNVAGRSYGMKGG